MNRMGYTPIAIASSKSAELAVRYGAASYTSPDCVGTVKSLADKPIRRILDCITDAESAAICYSAIARTGGTYACLEECPAAWRSRRTVKVKEVMGFQVLGIGLDLGASTTYTRPGDQKLLKIGIQWAVEIQTLMETGKVKPHPLRELRNTASAGAWEAIIEGLEMLRRGEVRGQKLVVRIPQD